MAFLTNYHSHCIYCDGRADMESFLRFAVSEGFTSYGVTSHAPLPFSTAWTMEWDRMDDYLAEHNYLKEKYADKIEFYVGLEIDYLNESSNPSSECFQKLPLDYRIGSVHLLYGPCGEIVDIDVNAEKFRSIVDEHFGGDLDLVIRLYYNRILRMIELGGFDIIGHCDKIHYNASMYRPGLLDEVWYDNLMKEYFLRIAQSGCIVEINTKAYDDKKVFFPNERYFGLLRDLLIPVTVNSDAHYPDKINAGRNAALVALRQAGIDGIMELQRNQWVKVPF